MRPPHLEKNLHTQKNRADGVAQGIGPELKPGTSKKKKCSGNAQEFCHYHCRDNIIVIVTLIIIITLLLSSQGFEGLRPQLSPKTNSEL
jgi:hypothetical protein